MLKQKEYSNNLRAEGSLKKIPAICSVFNFTSRTSTYNEQGVCSSAFPRLAYFTNVCRLWILATLWERCTCTNIGPVRFPLLSPQPRQSYTSVYLSIRDRLLFFHQSLILASQTRDLHVSPRINRPTRVKEKR